MSCLRLLGPRWEYIWFVAMPLYFRQTFPGLTSASTADINERVALVLRRFQSFREAVYYHHLDKLWRMKPILKGDQVIKLLNIKKPTQYVHRLLCELVVWQIGQMKRHLSRMPILDEKEKDSLMKDTCQEIPQIEAEKYILELDATQKHLLMSPEYPKY